MTTFPFELVSPERVLFAGDVTSVVVPGAEGEMTVLANHAPFMSALRAGIVTVDGGKRLFVQGGFVDVSPSGLTLLAEKAVPVEEINAEKAMADLKDAEEDLRDAKSDEDRARVTERVEGLKAMLAAVRH
jgi:F-type H+-transporting ATPase subunit epsilon